MGLDDGWVAELRGRPIHLSATYGSEQTTDNKFEVTYVVEPSALAPHLGIRTFRLVALPVADASFDLGREGLVRDLRLPV